MKLIDLLFYYFKSGSCIILDIKLLPPPPPHPFDTTYNYIIVIFRNAQYTCVIKDYHVPLYSSDATKLILFGFG
jgi:hypothetical protein